LSNILLKDKNGIDNTFSGVDVIKIRDSEGKYNNYVAEPQGEIQITSNGTFDVKEKAEVVVNVPNEIPDGYIKPSGELEITENGTYDVTDKSSVTVEVESESADGGFDIRQVSPKISMLGSVPFGNVGGNITTIYQDISNLTITKGA
jgi:hypothetical protein